MEVVFSKLTNGLRTQLTCLVNPCRTLRHLSWTAFQDERLKEKSE